MQVAAAGTGVRLADGSTNRIPVGDSGQPSARPGRSITVWSPGRSNAASTRAGTCTRRSCPPGSRRRSRSTADGYREAGRRLRDYLARQSSGVIDEPATARALAGFLLRGHECGAVTSGELRSATGLDLANIRKHAGRNGG